MPAVRSRSESFTETVLDVVESLERTWARELRTVEFAVEEVPPSDPAPWERGVPLGRVFPADAVAGLSPRIVLYRRVVEGRADGAAELAALIRAVVVEQVADLLGQTPETIDPGYRPD